MCEPRSGSKVASVPSTGEPRTGGNTADAALPGWRRDEGSPSPTCWQRSPCWGQEQSFPLARPGALESHCLNSTFRPTVPPSTAAPRHLAFDSALAAAAAAPVMWVPRARAPALALHRHPREAGAASEREAGGRGRPCPCLGRTQASGDDVTAATVTRGGKPTKRSAGLGLCISAPW